MNFFSICSNSGSEPRRGARRRGVLQRLDREIDLAVLLDGDDLRLDDVALAEMVVHVLHVVPVDLGDVDEPEASVFELEEGPVRGDAGDGAVDHRADFDLCDDGCSFLRLAARPTRPARTRRDASVREAPSGASMGRGARTRRSSAPWPRSRHPGRVCATVGRCTSGASTTPPPSARPRRRTSCVTRPVTTCSSGSRPP